MNIFDYISNPNMLYAFLLLIPLLILYFIRPKPPKKQIPSLIFFLEDRIKKNKNSFFNMLFANTLLIIQLFAICLLCTSALGVIVPFYTESSSHKSVIVIDASASMKAWGDGGTLYELSVSEAKKRLSEKNTIILSYSKPLILAANESSRQSEQLLSRSSCSDLPGDISAAIREAKKHMTQESVLYIFSDTKDFSKDSLKSTMNQLKQEGILYELWTIKAEPYTNIGFVDVSYEYDSVTAYIENFNDYSQDIQVTYNGKTTQVSVAEDSIHELKFSVPDSYTVMKIEDKDSFPTDNELHVCVPENRIIKALVITDEISDYLEAFFNSLPYMDYTKTTPLLLEDVGDYDLIILNNLDYGNIRPSVMKKISEKVREGMPIIIMAQDNLRFDLEGFFPYDYHNLLTDPEYADVLIPDDITENIDFGILDKYYNLSARQEVQILVQTESEIPLITFSNFGDGEVMYYGIFDDQSDFKLNVGYPVFWKRVISRLTDQKGLADINYRTGQMFFGGEVISQAGSLNRNHAYCANLLNRLESSGFAENLETASLINMATGSTDTTNEMDLTNFIIILSIVIILIEIIYLKIRGDI